MRAVLAPAILLVVAGCGGSSAPAPAPEHASRSIVVSSSAFADGAPIPAAYTCQGQGGSPPLSWDHLPASTRAVALVVDDPDAPHGTYTHWVVVDIAPGDRDLAAGHTPTGGVELRASGGTGWTAPCPPSGTHHYRFSVYALAAPTGLTATASLDDAMAAIDRETIAWGRLTGTVTAP